MKNLSDKSLFFKKNGYGIKLEMGSKGVKELQFVDPKHLSPSSKNEDSIRKYIVDWLEKYFDGNDKPFLLEYLDFSEATPFQKKVWRQLQKIPFGGVKSYQWVAEKIGVPKGPRAVGQANSRNPYPLLIPCHRVISADGSLGGYSSGLTLKKKLLVHEGVIK